MRRQSFLNKLREEGKLGLVEPSEEICNSYLGKADNCLKSARLLYENDLYENSISMSYYAMYNSLIALLFRVGIKCENHAGSILLLKKLFKRIDLFSAISFAKEERIDKQYYVTPILTKESAQDMFKKAEEFVVQVKLIIRKLGTKDIECARVNLKAVLPR